MITKQYSEVVTDELAQGAIINREFDGFERDYLVLHALIRKYKPKSFFEVGTNMGTGTRIIKNAIGDGEVYSLDLPFDEVHESMIHGERDMVGSNCSLPFIQLRGDSLTFDFSEYPCEGAWIDSEHDYDHPYREAVEMIKNKTFLIVFHDYHVVSVQDAIRDAFNHADKECVYNIYHVEGTRVVYALRDVL